MTALHVASARTLYRAFKIDGNRRPRCGTAGSMLGVRDSDVAHAVDHQGNVHPERGGLSVTPDDPKRMRPFLRPSWLGGHGPYPVFMIETTALGTRLGYRPDPDAPLHHGFVEPASVMPRAAYQAALEATRPDWKEVRP